MLNIRISVRKDENIEKAIKRFKRSCEKAGIKAQVKARRYYIKPSEVERNKKNKKNRKKETRLKKPKPTSQTLPVEMRPFHLYDQ